MAPHWHVNAHSMIYITQGSSRFQVANCQGKLVFDGEVKEGQIILVPQNFVVLKKAGKQGCEWVAFKTNDNAMTTFVAGRLSAIRAMPVEKRKICWLHFASYVDQKATTLQPIKQAAFRQRIVKQGVSNYDPEPCLARKIPGLGILDSSPIQKTSLGRIKTSLSISKLHP
ncbi:13S globulin basic chain [Forsythia ovata]|uniref:13S globulin basic chain n=1 Tax=Forsythia ovata TaxID=205694 RepID=A0ABD1PI54_9LAMI